MKGDTICAIATATGGALGIVRISGPDAITASDHIFVSSSHHRLVDCKPYTLHYGHIMDGEETIDEVMASLCRAPHSYTGEDTVEFTCHGSPYILQRVLQLLIAAGCRLAMPGEYTQRAFLNGKMDLSQAEAVADLIASTSAATHRLAMNQMRGGFSKELSALRDKLLHFTSLIELELDFSEEDVEFANRDELRQLADEIAAVLSRLAHSFSVGNVIKNGVPVAIIGETNSGKSTLLNVLLNEERAIVSDIQGTTRDVIEDTMNIGGITFRFIDTAGIRDTHDRIETMGIERTFQKMDQAEIILWMVDATQACEQVNRLDDQIAAHAEGKQLVLVLNKCDLLTASQQDSLASLLDKYPSHIFISAKRDEHIAELRQLLITAAHLPSVTQNDVIVTNARHYEALTAALTAIQRVQQGLASNLSGDFISQDIRECIFHLSDIAGEVTSDDVLHNIFKHFCIGK
jgi:tRNA modification GTPase